MLNIQVNEALDVMPITKLFCVGCRHLVRSVDTTVLYGIKVVMSRVYVLINRVRNVCFGSFDSRLHWSKTSNE